MLWAQNYLLGASWSAVTLLEIHKENMLMGNEFEWLFKEDGYIVKS